MSEILALVHVVSGCLALAAAAVAGSSKALGVDHRWHVVSGNAFVWSMAGIFVTAVPLAVLQRNPFLLLVAILSCYFAVAGWRYATHRSGRPRVVDWGSALAMISASLVMLGIGVVMLATGNGTGVVTLVLGGIGAVLSTRDLRRLAAGAIALPERIATHLTMMLAGSVAIITAFVVVNVETGSAIVAWLAPTVALSPVIALWSHRVRSGRVPRGAREE